MTETFKFLFHYMEKNDIIIDKPEFLFQIQSHPDYPSLLSITDTLSFFNIENGVVAIQVKEIDLLPDLFVALLADENGSSQLYFIEKKDGSYFCTKDTKSKEVSISTFESRWLGIALLVEKSELNELKIKKNNSSWVLSLLCLVIFSVVLFQFNIGLKVAFFFVFIFMGILFSIAALKDLFGTSILVNEFCNITPSTSCSTIIGSEKWKIFRIANYSDLSIIFFVSQFLGLLLFTISGNTFFFLAIQKMILLISLPVLVSSLYFQKFVEKKWCPICLVITVIILTELFYLILFIDVDFSISNQFIVLHGFIFILTMLIWLLLKKTLMQLKDLKEFQLKSNRFLRNYDIFKNTLLSKERKELPEPFIILGNKESKTSITVISSPFCGHCKGTHEILGEILKKYHEDIRINIIFKANFERESEYNKKLFRTLYKIYSNYSNEIFEKALNDWFDNKSIKHWLNLHDEEVTPVFDHVIQHHDEWCNENNIAFTPTIFINGYEFPNTYERSNLEFFISELIDDHHLYNNVLIDCRS